MADDIEAAKSAVERLLKEHVTDPNVGSILHRIWSDLGRVADWSEAQAAAARPKSPAKKAPAKKR